MLKAVGIGNRFLFNGSRFFASGSKFFASGSRFFVIDGRLFVIDDRVLHFDGGFFFVIYERLFFHVMIFLPHEWLLSTHI